MLVLPAGILALREFGIPSPRAVLPFYETVLPRMMVVFGDDRFSSVELVVEVRFANYPKLGDFLRVVVLSDPYCPFESRKRLLPSPNFPDSPLVLCDETDSPYATI